MAFTFSHIVVAPLIYRCCGQRLPLAALVIGTMLPDLARVIFNSPINHHISGMFTINLLCGLCFYFAWTQFYRPITYALLQRKQQPHRARDIRSFLLICTALLLGNFSHLLWDSFTHLDDRTWFAHNFLALSVNIFGVHMPMHRFLQYFTSLIALPFLYAFIKEFHRLEITPSHLNYINQKMAILYFGCVLIAALILSGTYLYFFVPMAELTTYGLLFISFKTFSLTAFALLSGLYLMIQQKIN